jgi:hypothetical protein
MSINEVSSRMSQNLDQKKKRIGPMFGSLGHLINGEDFGLLAG